MKTKITLKKLTCVAAVVLFTYACENITNPEPISVINEDRTATIQGAVYANLDETSGENERAPENTIVKVVMDSRDFVANPVPGINYQTLTYTTTVDESGNYSIEVPALHEPINARIYLDNFTANQVQSDETEVSKIYRPSTSPYNVQVTADFTTFQDLYYDDFDN